jgi:hypothetical protein
MYTNLYSKMYINRMKHDRIKHDRIKDINGYILL